jgi:hypothetical protein
MNNGIVERPIIDVAQKIRDIERRLVAVKLDLNRANVHVQSNLARRRGAFDTRRAGE